MKRSVFNILTVTVLFLAAASVVHAQTGSGHSVPTRVGTNEDFDAALSNPAALAVGNASGFAVRLGYDPGADVNIAPDTFDLYFNGLNSSYILSGTGDGLRHTFAAGVPIGDYFSLGAAYRAARRDWDAGTVTAGGLLRPLSFLSLGAVGNYALPDETLSGVVGFGFRPLMMSEEWRSRVTLYGDVAVTGQTPELSLFGIESEPIDGIRLRIGYAPPADRVQAELSVALGHARSGVRNSVTEESFGEIAGFTHVSHKRFRSVHAPSATVYAEYSPGPNIVSQHPLPSFSVLSDRTGNNTVYEVIDQIETLRDDPTVAGIVFRNHTLNASFAEMLEVREALQRFRESGKRVVFYFESVGNLNYALAASVADRIFLAPSGKVDLTGVGSTTPYIRDLLARVGIQVVNLPVGKYKSAGNMFSENSMPEPEREARLAVLQENSDVLRGMIVEGRGEALNGSIDRIVDDGPYLRSNRALEAGLVDKLIYDDKLAGQLRSLTSRATVEEASFPEQVSYEWQDSAAARVALIVASGRIRPGDVDPTVGIGSDTLRRALERARTDQSIEGVLLRVDSGGGSALASDVIAREVARLAEQKPVVVSMGATAASGGYYIAVPATEIVAHPVTVTGSIGVVALLPNITELSDRVGIGWEQLLIGENAQFASPFDELTEAERQRILDGMTATYDRFVETVAEHREMRNDQVRNVAEGRIWSGAQARERGLVDHLGGVEVARAQLREHLDTERLELVRITGRTGPLHLPPLSHVVAQLGTEALPRELAQPFKSVRALTRERLYYVLLDPPLVRE